MKTQTLRNATFDEVCRMDQDNFTSGDYWFLVDVASDSVTIAEQKALKSPTQTITIPRKIFNRFIDNYLKSRELR